MAGRPPVWPASQSLSANWSRLAEAKGRPELALALAGRAGGRVGRSLWAADFHTAPHREDVDDQHDETHAQPLLLITRCHRAAARCVVAPA
eukprot:scaffold123817_cov51-Phaeocystis_antarctica.AAC.3